MKTKPVKSLVSIREDGAVPPRLRQGAARRGMPVLPHVKQHSGVALLIVLGMLVLLSVIVLAFVQSVTNDLGDSAAYSNEINTRMLADSAVNLVISEIRTASTGTGQAWISQPGLLRTYGMNGQPIAAYKLYSNSNMVVSGSFDPVTGSSTGDLPGAATNSSGTNWLNQPNMWTDLNSPIANGTTSSGSISYIFPIIDGNNIQSFSVSGSNQLAYTTDGVIPTIEGFATAPNAVGINFNQSAAPIGANNPVPMPVQWLYMLKDGTLISGSAAGRDVTFSGSIVPSGTNPIVARIAFWTDDESCKVDINTASEGTFWDTPVCNTQPNVSDPGGNDPVGKAVFDPNQIFEWDLAQRQCDQNEYQRYPGHPAETCLSPVLGDTIFKGMGFTPGQSITGYGADYGYHTLTGTAWATFTEFIDQLAPRVSGSDAMISGSDYSSRGGTYRAGGSTLYSSGISQSLNASTGQLASSYSSGTWITPDQNPLYASVGDYFYSGTIPSASTPTTTTSGSMRVNNGFLLTGTGGKSGFAGPVLTPSLLAKARFFLTADSKSPELNVFNMPRVCMWPITRNATPVTLLDNPDLSNASVTATMTNFDKVIAFCASLGMNGANTTTGTVPFYFVRYDPFSQTNDFANSTNNQNLYNYLHMFMQQPWPGFSSSASATFVSKYPQEDIGSANQILTEMYDYIRCINLADCSEDLVNSGNYGAKSFTQVNPLYQWTVTNWDSQTSQGQVVPIVIPTTVVNGTSGVSPGSAYTRGIGRIAMPGELTMIMTKEDERINSAAAENATQAQITVSTGQYKGTWTFNNPQPNTNNVLLKETTKGTVYVAATEPTTAPSQDYPLVPDAGGLLGPGMSGTTSVSGGTTYHTYDPRTQTKVQFVLLPFYYCPMAGFSAMGNNLRLHFTNVHITAVGTAATGPKVTGTVAYAPTSVSPYVATNGTQGQDLYDTGRIDTINEGSGKIGGVMGAKSLIDSSETSTGYVPSDLGSPFDSMCPAVEAVVDGVSAPDQGFNSSGSNTMVVSGTAVMQVLVPADPVNSSNSPNSVWKQRGINDKPSVIQSYTFAYPSGTVQIPTLNSGGGGNAHPWVSLQGGTTTLSGNTSTAESMVISATNSGSSAAVVDVKEGGASQTGISRLNRDANGGNNFGAYSNYMISCASNDIFRSLPLSGTLPSGVLVQGDYRMAAAMAFIPPSMYEPVQKYTATGTMIPVIGGNGNPGNFNSGSLTPYYSVSQQGAYGWRSCIFAFNWGGSPAANSPGYLVSSGTTGNVIFPQYGDNIHAPYVPLGVDGVYNYEGSPGDWDNAPGWLVDGACCNKPDEGWVRHWEAQEDFVASSVAPFIGHSWGAEDAALGMPSLYAPNKMVSSPVMFGSLPTGVLSGHPWQTLLFRPAKPYFPGGSDGAAGNVYHPGAGVCAGGPSPTTTGVIDYPPYSTLPDHLLLDLFWMPVVDPYPISEPFATSGKVNLNYQIAPFTYITRKTAMRAVLQSVKITALNPTTVDNVAPYNPGMPNSAGNAPYFAETYKIPGSNGDNDDATGGIGNGGGLGVCVRRNIDLDSTLKEIDYLRFGVPGHLVDKPFITASEICDVPLIPADLPTNGNAQPYNIHSRIQSAANPGQYDTILADFWYGNPANAPNGSPPTFGHRLTGDNSLERPYSMIYPRLTTKSNTYTVHVRVQTLKKLPSTPANVFKDGQDQVLGEFRGSYVVERYLDPATAGFYSGTTPVTFSSVINSPGTAQVGPYKFRIVSSKQFGQ